MAVLAHLRLSAIVSTLDSLVRGKLVDSRSPKQAAPQWICLFQFTLGIGSLIRASCFQLNAGSLKLSGQAAGHLQCILSSVLEVAPWRLRENDDPGAVQPSIDKVAGSAFIQASCTAYDQAAPETL